MNSTVTVGVTSPPSGNHPNLLPPQGIRSHNTTPTSKQDVVDLILRDPEYVECYILFLYHRQEGDEKARHKTIHGNGVGFNAADGGLLTSMAERLLSGYSLSSDDLAACREPTKKGKPRLAKYWRQLLNAHTEGVQ
jgi:hypothetical protein